MRVFNSEMHLLTFIFIILESGMLVFYQLPHYLSRPQDSSRLYYLILLLLLLVYNLAGGLFPDPGIPLPVKVQNILAYGAGFLVASYFPYFFYKTLKLQRLRFHALYGVPLFLLLPYLTFFMGYYAWSGNLEATIKWGMVVPFFYSFIILWAILRAIRLKYLQEDSQGFAVNKWEALGVYAAVLPWICLAVFEYFSIAQWIEMLVTNIGFVLLTAVFMVHAVRRHRRALDLLDALQDRPAPQSGFEENLLKFNFSARELEIIRLLKAGLGTKTIAQRLFIATSTVSRHMQNIYHKARVNTRIELMQKIEKAILTGYNARRQN